MELGYKDRNGDGFLNGGFGVGSLGYGEESDDFDPFPEDVPVWE